MPPCAWQPCTNHEIEQTRRCRRVRRLERRLKVLRAAQLRFLYRDGIAALEKELASLLAARQVGGSVCLGAQIASHA